MSQTKSPFQIFIEKITRFAELVTEYPEILNEHGAKRASTAREFVALSEKVQREVSIQLFLGNIPEAAKAGHASEKLAKAWMLMFNWFNEPRPSVTTGPAQSASAEIEEVSDPRRITLVGGTGGAVELDPRQTTMFPTSSEPTLTATEQVVPVADETREPEPPESKLALQRKQEAQDTAKEFGIKVARVIAMHDGTDATSGKPTSKSPNVIAATLNVPHWVVCKILKAYNKMQKLSFSENELLALREKGLTDAEIATKIGTDEHTVKKAFKIRQDIRELQARRMTPGDPFAKPDAQTANLPVILRDTPAN